MACKQCGMVQTDKDFCSARCRQQYHSYQRYIKIKDTPEYKLKQKESFNRWLEKNRDHFNDLCRERNKIYQRKKRAEAKEKGFCSVCFKKKVVDGFVTCPSCREWNKNYQKMKVSTENKGIIKPRRYKRIIPVERPSEFIKKKFKYQIEDEQRFEKRAKKEEIKKEIYNKWHPPIPTETPCKNLITENIINIQNGRELTAPLSFLKNNNKFEDTYKRVEKLMEKI